MKPLRTTLFVIAFVMLASQTFRHAYVRWMEPRGSVLDKYDTQTGKQITTAKSLGELVALYDVAHAKVVEEEKVHPPKVETEGFYRTNRDVEPFKSDEQLRHAIKEWEEKSKEIGELWHFWLAGLIALAVGFAAMYKSDRWLGIALVILAFSEMIWATCPSFRALGSAQPEFDRLLIQKFALSLVSLFLLLYVWFTMRRHDLKQSPPSS